MKISIDLTDVNDGDIDNAFDDKRNVVAEGAYYKCVI